MSSGCLDFACAAWQNLACLQDGSVLDDQFDRALVTFGMLAFRIFHVNDARILHVRFGRDLVIVILLEFCMISLAELRDPLHDS